jgi:uncharacterized HAD superfamily protein
MSNPKTIFCDIDGTLIEQLPFEDINCDNAFLLPGVAEKMNEWYQNGHYIVLTTARPETMREITVTQLASINIFYHQLVMGVGRHERILINNNATDTPNVPRALAVDIPKDAGFVNIDFSVIGL